MADLARLNHENIGKLLGYCREDTPFTRMLVFDYASNGTLHDHLHCCKSSFSGGVHVTYLKRFISFNIQLSLQMKKDVNSLGHGV